MKRFVPAPLDAVLVAGVAVFCAGVGMIYPPGALIALGMLSVAGALRLGAGK